MTGGEAAEEEALGPHGAIVFALIDQWVKVTGREPPEVEQGSPLYGDARNSPSLQVAHAAWTAIVHSVDHLHAFRALLGQAQIINLGAPYTCCGQPWRTPPPPSGFSSLASAPNGCGAD